MFARYLTEIRHDQKWISARGSNPRRPFARRFAVIDRDGCPVAHELTMPYPSGLRTLGPSPTGREGPASRPPFESGEPIAGPPRSSAARPSLRDKASCPTIKFWTTGMKIPPRGRIVGRVSTKTGSEGQHFAGKKADLRPAIRETAKHPMAVA